MSVDCILISAERMERLRETHNFTLEHEGVLGTVFCLIGLCEGPIGLGDRVIAAHMNCSPRKWIGFRDYFIERDIFYLTDDGALYIRGEGKLFKFPTKGRRRLPTEMRAAADRRTNACCCYCGTLKGPFHYDHILPVARGGRDDASNITLACVPCNSSKGDKTLQEWVAFLRLREAARG